jgi:uncharacterized lipoprotein YehR (DUF1307 family)
MTGSYKQGRKGLTAGTKASLAQVLVLAAILVGLIFVFAGCGGGGGLQGTWVNEQEGSTVVVTGDTITETSSTGTLEFKYKAEGNTLNLTMEGITDALTMTYKLDGDTLTLTSQGEDMAYTRK